MSWLGIGNFKSWDVWAVCPCGYRRRCPFGDPFHIHVEVCPKCGTDKDDWKVGTWRKIKGVWEERGSEAAGEGDNAT